jgi:hypothetical protein
MKFHPRLACALYRTLVKGLTGKLHEKTGLNEVPIYQISLCNKYWLIRENPFSFN